MTRRGVVPHARIEWSDDDGVTMTALPMLGPQYAATGEAWVCGVCDALNEGEPIAGRSVCGRCHTEHGTWWEPVTRYALVPMPPTVTSDDDGPPRPLPVMTGGQP